MRLATARKGRGRDLWLIGLLFWAVCTIRADVVYRHPGHLHSQLEAFGGKKGYSAPVTINGADGTITVYAFDESPAALAARTPGTLPLKQGITSLHTKKGHIRALVSPMPKGKSSVFILETETAVARPPQMPPLPAMPHYAQSEILLTVKNKRSNSALCVSAINGVSPDQVHQALQSQLLPSGWSAAIPGSSTSLGMFFKGDQICLIYAQAEEPTAPTLITVLHKSRAVE